MTIENTDEDKKVSATSASPLKDAWSIRPCELYDEEYKDCTSIKARFHQYFIYGRSIDCEQWKCDYINCVRYEKSNGNDVEAGKAVIDSEAERRRTRMEAHYGNKTWKKRSSPPENWSKPLPESLRKRSENSYLEIKQKELNGEAPVQETKNFCAIM